MIHDNEFTIRGTKRKVIQVPGDKNAKSQAKKDIAKYKQEEQLKQIPEVKPYKEKYTYTFRLNDSRHLWIYAERQKLIDGGKDVNPLP